MDNQPMLDLLWHSRFRWQLPLDQVTGDTRYGTSQNIVAIEHAGIRAYVPLPDFDKRTPFYGKHRFTYAADHDQYHCPQGALLPRRKTKYTGAGDRLPSDCCDVQCLSTQSEMYRE